MRDRVGDQGWQARTHGEESVVLGDHNRILEFSGCDLLTRRVDALGHSELRKRPAAAGDGHWTWSGAVAVSKDQSGIGLQTELISRQRHRELRKPNRLHAN